MHKLAHKLTHKSRLGTAGWKHDHLAKKYVHVHTRTIFALHESKLLGKKHARAHTPGTKALQRIGAEENTHTHTHTHTHTWHKSLAAHDCREKVHVEA
jgi:hypothetical protein